MNCRNYHPSGQDPRCPYCVIAVLCAALKKAAPDDPALSPGLMILDSARKEEERGRRVAVGKSECGLCQGLGVSLAADAVTVVVCRKCGGQGTR